MVIVGKKPGQRCPGLFIPTASFKMNELEEFQNDNMYPG
jgi:hypothetical protein